MSTLIETTSNKLVKAFLKNKIISPTKLKSNYFIKKHYKKKSNYKFPKIIYPYSPI